MAIRIVRHPSRGHLAPRKVNVVTGKLAAFRDWDDWKYTLGKLPPRYPMPVVKPNYIMSNWYDRAAYSVWLWSHSEQDIENGIWYHAEMDNREAGLI